MSDLVSVTLDNVPSDQAALCSIAAAAQNTTVSTLSLTSGLNQMVDMGIQAAAAKLAADPSKIPASVTAQLQSISSIADALERIKTAGGDLSDVVAAVS